MMVDLKSKLQIGDKLGAGHFGEVFLGDDPVHGDVAVKIYRQLPAEDPDEWQARKDSLLHEGQRLSQADHPNVVRVHYLVEEDGGAAIHLVMQLCSGGSLQSSFENGPMCLADVRKVATDVTLGLQALHGRGMLHRDIKPGNLLLDENNLGKLGDFGLVTDEIMFGYASGAGYSDHLAYELWHGVGSSVRSDIWALGMTLYRLIHGADWYARVVKPRHVIKDGGIADKLEWLPHVPKRWRTVIRKMLDDDPHSRYQNADQVLAALATLETEPNWKCVVGSSQITWRTQKNARRISVVWKACSSGKYTWLAESLPVGKGRSRRLAGSAGQVSYKQAERGLRAYFA